MCVVGVEEKRPRVHPGQHAAESPQIRPLVPIGAPEGYLGCTELLGVDGVGVFISGEDTASVVDDLCHGVSNHAVLLSTATRGEVGRVGEQVVVTTLEHDVLVLDVGVDEVDRVQVRHLLQQLPCHRLYGVQVEGLVVIPLPEVVQGALQRFQHQAHKGPARPRLGHVEGLKYPHTAVVPFVHLAEYFGFLSRVAVVLQVLLEGEHDLECDDLVTAILLSQKDSPERPVAQLSQHLVLLARGLHCPTVGKVDKLILVLKPSTTASTASTLLALPASPTVGTLSSSTKGVAVPTSHILPRLQATGHVVCGPVQ
eukprot:Sspe_Gene.97613::Locus_71175_Transcript_1_1_Confidence_1.000_Length_1300::g.97613::m.97613